MQSERWLDVLKKARHSSGGVYPYLWIRAEKPPVRSGATASFIRFCAWLEGTRPGSADRAKAPAEFLRSKMLNNGAVPYEMTPGTLAPVKECPYLVSDSMSVALAGQACGDEDLLGRSLDFIRWSYGQLPGSKFLPMWFHFESPQSSMPDHWSQQATCHQSVVAQLELDEFVCSTWGESVTDDFGEVLASALASRTAAGFFDADRYRPPAPLQPHFATCESVLKYFWESGEDDMMRTAAAAVRVGVDALLAADGKGDAVEPDGRIIGPRRTLLLATAIRAGLMANAALAEDVVPRPALKALAGILAGSELTDGPLAGLLPVSSDSSWEEDTLACVPGCLAAFQACGMLSAPDALGMDDFRLLV